MEQLMSDQTNQAVTKYADTIIQWGGVFRTILTALGWIYLVGGPLIGLLGGGPRGFILGILVGIIGAVGMFGYRIIFDYLLMKAHQAKG
jgi:hypothetical protein